MRLDLGFVLGYGHQHLGHAVANLVLDDILDYQQGQEHSDSRINEEEIIVG